MVLCFSLRVRSEGMSLASLGHAYGREKEFVQFAQARRRARTKQSRAKSERLVKRRAFVEALLLLVGTFPAAPTAREIHGLLERQGPTSGLLFTQQCLLTLEREGRLQVVSREGPGRGGAKRYRVRAG